ncbi:hypothetical protein CANARDRAFT_7014 [[Candida] arabinofermentans NRRL YB-2248]|uniref:Uncharacterized protein n=1 Tax=[Candida] arabinofermentans NRRL YB-2248 TaxID=983967 RepID=A0A1E4T483_9ASCO|nr:hypothetical protein CANARDRAFT_7014 [[Candida] arabinofermentans NRRL YB-2248]
MSTFFRDANLFKPKSKASIFSSLNQSSNFFKIQKGVVEKQVDLPKEVETKENLSTISEDNNESNSTINADVNNQQDSPITVANSSSDFHIANKNIQKLKNNEEEDDDLEITNVRILQLDSEVIKDSRGDETPTPAPRSRAPTFNLEKDKLSNNNTDQVSMQYLLNALSHLNKIKDELEMKLKSSEGQLNEYKAKLNSNTEIATSLKKKLKVILSTVNDSNNEVKYWKNKVTTITDNSNKILEETKSIKASVVSLERQVQKYKSTLESLKSKLSSSNSLISKREMELISLDARLDDMSGRLSEEKIKNSQLDKLLDESRKLYGGEMKLEAAKNAKLVEEILNFNKELKNQLAEQFKQLLDSNSSIGSISNSNFDKLFNTISTEIDKLTSTFNDNQSKLDLLSSKTDESSHTLKEVITSLIQNVTIETSNQGQIIDTLNSNLLKLVGKIDTNANDDEYKNILAGIDKLQSSMESTKQIEEKFKFQLDALTLQHEEQSLNFANLKEQHTLLNDQYQQQKQLIEELETQNSNYVAKVAELHLEIDCLKEENSKQLVHAEEMKKTHFNEQKNTNRLFESKLRTQDEILKMATAETEKLKGLNLKNEDQNQKLIQELNQLSIKYDNLNAQYIDETSLNSKLEKDILVKESQLAELKSQFESNNQFVSEEKSQLSVTVDKLEKQNRSYLEMIKKLKLEKQEKIETINKLKRQNEMMNQSQLSKSNLPSPEKLLVKGTDQVKSASKNKRKKNENRRKLISLQSEEDISFSSYQSTEGSNKKLQIDKSLQKGPDLSDDPLFQVPETSQELEEKEQVLERKKSRSIIKTYKRRKFVA